MEVLKNQIDKLNLELTVKVAPEDYAPVKKKKLAECRRKAEFKGFRKGMVPMSLVEKFYGEQCIADAVNDLVGESLYNYINENGIHTLGEPLPSEKQPEVTWADGQEFTFVFDLATPEKVNVDAVKEDTVPCYKIGITADAKKEMAKNLKKYYEEKKEEKSDEEIDKEVTDRLEFEYKQESEARLNKDIRNYFVEKAAIELPEGYLKRWLYALNKGKYSMEDIEKEFPSFVDDFRWQLVRDHFTEKYGIQISDKELKEAAEGFVTYQYAMYGLGNVPAELIQQAAADMLANQQQVSRLQEQVENSKVLEALKNDITIKDKKISVEKFRELK